MSGATVTVICANRRCRAPFVARVADRKRGWAKYCSKSCKAVVQEKRTGQYANYLHRRDREDGSGGDFIKGAALDNK